MARILTGLGLAVLLGTALARADGPGDDDLRKQPITTHSSEAGKLLKKWWSEGTAAGNVGDWYDNRDGAHSDLDTRPFPQLRRVVYTPDDVKARRHWAAANAVRPQVTFGNSSTSAPAELGGSNVRSYYAHPRGLPFLYLQYTRNNLYIYPEHRDHDPGRNGVGDGYGDLYPTNTPYLITSQGSSGSDQPFMRAVPLTLAAFRPEVKKKLAEDGLLMPTVQMIFRASNRHLKEPKEYLTGKAHPTVFEGAWVDERKMAEMAHALTLDTLPPAVRLEVQEEDEVRPGRDFFEAAGVGEKLGTTPGCIARVWRGTARKRRMLVSAKDSVDPRAGKGLKPLTFTWALLRGDPRRVTINPRDAAGTSAVLEVEYHERMPVAAGSAMESNRIDIACFAHNGEHYSAPAFVTFFSLDGETRTYDDRGRILEVGYSSGGTTRTITDPAGLMEDLAAGPGSRLFPLTPAQRDALKAVATELAAPAEAQAVARQKKQEAEKARNEANQAVQAAEAALKKADAGAEAGARKRVAGAKEQARKAEVAFKESDKRLGDTTARVEGILAAERKDLPRAPRAFLDRLLAGAAEDPTFWNSRLATLAPMYADAPAPRRGAIDTARRRLVEVGVVEKSDVHKLAFRPARSGEGDPAARLTRYERSQLEYFQSAVLAELLFPGKVQAVWRNNFVDQRITAPRRWRDVYRHDGSGNLAGWTRYESGKASEFTSGGFLVLQKDDQGRASKARTVEYRQKPPPAGRFGFNSNPLEAAPGDEVVTIEWEDGKPVVKKREKVDPEPKGP